MNKADQPCMLAHRVVDARLGYDQEYRRCVQTWLVNNFPDHSWQFAQWWSPECNSDHGYQSARTVITGVNFGTRADVLAYTMRFLTGGGCD